MATDIGYLRSTDKDFLEAWLDKRGIGWTPGIGQWQVIHIRYGGFTCVVTRNKQEQYKSPIELRPLLLEFREYMASLENPETKDEISDSERLDFILRKGRQVVTEIEGWGSEGRHYAIYVTEGVMDDKKYPAMRFTAEDFNSAGEEGRKIKREAIDLAIIEFRSESSV
jgi:hypothetical protein